MKDRCAHKLHTVGMGKNPDCWVVVQGAVKQVHASEADDWGHPELCVWQAAIMCSSESGVAVLDGGAGTTSSEWWEWLRSHVGSGMGRVYIYSLGATEQCSILDLWGCVESQEATLATKRTSGDAAASPDEKVWDDGLVILGGPPTIVQFMLSGRATRFTWLDPRNYGSGDLSVNAHDDPGSIGVCRWVGEPHTVPERVGCQVEAVMTWLQSYLDMCGALRLGAVEFTSASQAHSGFRRSYLKESVTIHDNDTVINLERESLYGGRCECSQIGEVPGPIYHLDVNSLYPSVAYTAMLPVRLEAVVKYPNLETIVSAPRHVPCVARVYVQMDRPAVPYRLKWGPNPEDTRLIWPVGTFWTTLTAPELILAQQCGRIVKAKWLAVYAGRTLYRHWVERLYGARLRCREIGDQVSANMVKSILNASFGKWSQVKSEWLDETTEVCPWPWYQWYQRMPDQWGNGERGPRTFEQGLDNISTFRSLGGRVQRQVRGGEPADSFPAITAHIHAAGRVRMWELMNDIRPGSIYYTDTDSLWVDGPGYDDLVCAGRVDPTRLGALKLVGKHDSVTFRGQKRYVADGQTVLAGANMGAAKIGDAFALVYKAPPTSHYLFHRDKPGTDRHTARVRIDAPYLHGHVQTDGSVRPIRVVDGIADENIQ